MKKGDHLYGCFKLYFGGFLQIKYGTKPHGTQNIALKRVFHTVQLYILGPTPLIFHPPSCRWLSRADQSSGPRSGHLPPECGAGSWYVEWRGRDQWSGRPRCWHQPGHSGQPAANTTTGLLTVSSVLLTSGNLITTSPLLNTGFSSINLDPPIL